MEHIIQQIANELVEKITQKSLNSLIGDLDALATDLEKDCKAAAKHILEVLIDNLNVEIRNDKKCRKKIRTCS